MKKQPVWKYLGFVTIMILLGCVALADDEDEVGDIADPYDLFDPVPKSLMRPMNTDRPGYTDTPHTLDAGHFQIETSLLDYSRNESGGVITKTYLINSMAIRAGLNIDTEAQVIVESYKIVQVAGVENKGFGDVLARLKFNLFGNDRGDLVGAILPFLKIPTNSGVGNDMFEGGLYFPVQWNPGDSWAISLMIGPEFVKNAANNSFHFELIGGLNISKAFGDFVPFVEYGSRLAEGKRYLPQVGCGLLYQVSDWFAVDGSFTYAFPEGQTTLNPYFGLSVRM